MSEKSTFEVDYNEQNVRAVDDLGRIAIPKEIRQQLKIKDAATFKIHAFGNIILLEPFSSSEVDTKRLTRNKL